MRRSLSPFFFFNDTATTEIYTLSLHDALPISTTTAASCAAVSPACSAPAPSSTSRGGCSGCTAASPATDRKSTRLNSSHVRISYAAFCLKKKTTYSCRIWCEYIGDENGRSSL